MIGEYVRRQFWPAFARGLDGLFLFNWIPTQLEKMALLEPAETGGVDTIPALLTVQQLAQFMKDWWPTLQIFEPASPAVSRFHTTVDEFAALNRRFTMTLDTRLGQIVADPSIKVLALMGNDCLDAASVESIGRWVDSGKPLIMDAQSFPPLFSRWTT